VGLAIAAQLPENHNHIGWVGGAMKTRIRAVRKAKGRCSQTGAQVSTLTGKDGSFGIDAPLQSRLLFSHPLFNSTGVRVNSPGELTIRLSKRHLQQLVQVKNSVTITDTTEILMNRRQRVNVLYSEKNQAELLGSYATVYGSQLATTPAPNYLYALPGRLAGLNVIQNRGFYVPLTSSLTDVDIFVGNIPKNNSGAGPSDNTEFNIQLRGHAGSAGQGPVTVVDGVQRDYFSLDPHSIESVTIAKDALSSILLGQNSSRGALIVTTKRPEAGAPRLSYTAETGLQTPLGFQNPLPAYQYAYLLNEALLNDGKQPAYTAADFAAYRDGSDPVRRPDVNWYN
ncbi:MAG: hypothetical protein EOP49_52850, partial [Sphingobacteriales bacterium]